MGGIYEDSTCEFNTLGYGTIGYSAFLGNVSCANTRDTITATFSQPVRGSSVRLRGKYPQRLVLTESGRSPFNVDLYPSYSGGQIIGGDVTVGLSGKKITGLTVKSTDPNYAFSLNNIVVGKIGASSPSASKPPPNYCNATPIDRPAPQIINSHDWTMNTEVTDRDGLVLTNVRLKGRLMAERISVPYYTIATSSTLTNRGELRPNDTSGTLRSRLVYYEPKIDADRLLITATYAIDNIPNSQSCLSITQTYEFTRRGLNAPCEPNDSLPCQSYRALVTYKFTGSGNETLRSINVAQRNHFTVNGATKNSVGLFRDCDSGIIDCVLDNYGIIFKDKINPLFTEYYTRVIVDGKDYKLWDNMHQTLQSSVTEPPSSLIPLVLGGCPECVHTHWRWGAGLGEHFGSGKLLIPSGSNQDLTIGIVRYRNGEERPGDFSDLIYSNPEPIRSKLTGIDLIGADHYKYTVPEDVVYWLSANGYKDSDEFFGYYSFFNPDSPNEIRTITREVQPFSSVSSQKQSISSLTGQDAPTSIKYGHLFEDGAATYNEIDPNTVASLPPGYVAYNSVSYDIRTEAEVSGQHTVTLNVPSVADQTTFDSLRVLHSEPDPFDSSQAIWVDRTVLPPDTPAPDFASQNIYAKVNHVGPFVIARFTPQPPNTNVADLSVSINDSVDPVTAGNQLTYTANVANNGPDAATGVIFNNGLSPDVMFVSVNAPQGACREEDATVICNLGTIEAGAVLPVTVVVEPNEGQIRFPPAGKTIANLAFVRANETDPDENNNSDTENTNALPNPNAPPTSQIQSPAAGAIFSSPATFTVVVGATDSDGTIAQVELFNDNVSVGNGTLLETGKYTVNLSNATYGEHSLIAVVTDNGGRKAISDYVRYFVNGPILISLDSPLEGSLLGSPVNIPLAATVANDSGTVAQVEFLANGIPIGNGTLSGTDQYNFTLNNVPIGPQSLRAIATDGNGVKSWSESVSIYVTYAPTINITAPAMGSSYPQPANIALSATARDFDGYISSVEFLVNETSSLGMGTLVGGDVFTRTWLYVSPGTYSFTAKATDDTGMVSISSPVTVTVTNAPPTVTMTSPADGSSYGPLPNILLSADAADSDGGVARVDFYTGTTLLGSAYSPPYEFWWNNAPTGNHSLTAKAADYNNAATISIPVSITVGAFGDTLLVVGSTTLSSVDTAIKTRLQNLGLNVVVKSATSAVTADATGKLVIVISDSVSPTNINTKFRTVTVPVVTLDPQLFDDMGMTAATTGNFGTTGTQKNVTITDVAHPMAAGLSGTVQVTSLNTTFGWGVVNANAAKIATLTTDTNKATSFGYANGTVMPGLTAPARRVGFFYTASSKTLTGEGILLFDNAVKWAAGL